MIERPSRKPEREAGETRLDRADRGAAPARVEAEQIVAEQRQVGAHHLAAAQQQDRGGEQEPERGDDADGASQRHRVVARERLAQQILDQPRGRRGRRLAIAAAPIRADLLVVVASTLTDQTSCDSPATLRAASMPVSIEWSWLL